MIITTFTDLYRFIKHPDDRQFDYSSTGKLQLISLLTLVQVIIVLVFITPLLLMIDDVLNLTMTDDNANFSKLQVFVAYVMAVPFIEELIFRHFLRYQGIKTFFIKSERWTKLFPFLVYASAFAFGFLHLLNFTNGSNLFYLLSPIIVLSQLIGGILIAYVRIRIDFLWGVLFHSTWNFTVLLVIPALEDLLKIA